MWPPPAASDHQKRSYVTDLSRQDTPVRECGHRGVLGCTGMSRRPVLSDAQAPLFRQSGRRRVTGGQDGSSAAARIRLVLHSHRPLTRIGTRLMYDGGDYELVWPRHLFVHEASNLLNHRRIHRDWDDRCVLLLDHAFAGPTPQDDFRQAAAQSPPPRGLS
ncbi:hypothetical protein Franean1_0050 [Parafrankia sp. EAN1pec]|nr:hypothetical protein Franean1_0050 [Frankia sp. EAN1pec]